MSKIIADICVRVGSYEKDGKTVIICNKCNQLNFD
jgi:hypothetical protein